MKLNQFIQKYPNKMFMRFFYDIEYDYYKTHHVCVYMKYDGDVNKTAQDFKRLFNILSIDQRDNKQTIKGYDRIFKATDLLKQFNDCTKIEVKYQDDQYYFLEVI